jgi:hypothetical protein
MSAIQANPPTQAPDSERPSVQKLDWTLDELARSLSVSVPFIRLEVKRGRLKAAHPGTAGSRTGYGGSPLSGSGQRN